MLPDRTGTHTVPAPIFVIGHSRSGTTLLRLMLCAHPRIYLTHEAMFYRTEPMFLRTSQTRAALAKYFRSRPFHRLGVDPERLLAGLPDPLPRERIGEVYAALMREKAAQYGRVRFGDKTPQYSAHIHRIFRDFPEARVIRIMRDPRAVAHSLSQVPFGSASVALNAMALSFDHRFAAKYRDQILTVRLEDLLADTRSVMTRVLDFVGELWDDAVLDHSRHIPEADEMGAQPWMGGATQERTMPTEKWRALSPAKIRLIEWLARGAMKEGGYERASFDPEPSRLAVLAEFWRQLPEVRRFMRISRRLAARFALHGEGAATDALHRQLNPAVWERYPALQFPPELPARSNAPP